MFSKIVIEKIRSIKSPTSNLLHKPTAITSLVFMQQVMVASCDLLRTALYSIRQGKFEFALRDYYRAHLQEEHGHAVWLANDLKTIGIDVKKIPLSRKAVEMAGTQYYLIRHLHPGALLGYMAVLEGFPMPMGCVEELERAHGKRLFRTLRYHAEHDIEHRKELFKVIDAVPTKYQEIVLNSAAQTAIYISEAAQEWQT
jgi:hypothetical protein